MKILDVKNTAEFADEFTEMKETEKGYTVLYHTYGGIAYVLELTPSEALWISETEPSLKRQYVDKFKDKFIDSLTEFIKRKER